MSNKTLERGIYIIWNDLAYLQYVLDVKVEYWGSKER